MFGLNTRERPKSDQYRSLSDFFPKRIITIKNVQRKINTAVCWYDSSRWFRRQTKAIIYLKDIRSSLNNNNDIDADTRLKTDIYLRQPSKTFVGLFFEPSAKKILRDVMKELTMVSS